MAAHRHGRALHFYPRPPRGGRPAGVGAAPNGGEISIHALREEGDRHPRAVGLVEPQISIHALREEGDPHHRGQRPREAISIHALREEGDLKPSEVVIFRLYISIHALREEGDRRRR